jgi:Mor family transcriptional regulator
MTIEFYTVLSKIIDFHLAAESIAAKKSEAIKDGLLKDIRTKLAGHSIYFKSTTAKDKLIARHKAICSDFNGSNHAELMTKYEIGHNWLLKILKRGAVDEKLIF